MCKECIKTKGDLQKIEANDQLFIKKLFYCYWDYFCAYFLKHSNLSQQEIKEQIYPEAFEIFIRKIWEGKTYDLFGKKQCTYLIEIGKIVIKRYWDKKGRDQLDFPDDETVFQKSIVLPEIEEFYNQEDLTELLERLLNQLKPRCKEIIKLKFLGWSFEAIKERMGFPSDGAARVKFHECMKKLRDLFNQL